MKAYGGVDVYIYIFLTSALAGGEWSASRPGHFIQEKKSQCLLDGTLAGLQSRPGRRGEQKILDPTGTRNPTAKSSSP
jgi:hypothetical protein